MDRMGLCVMDVEAKAVTEAQIRLWVCDFETGRGWAGLKEKGVGV